MKSTTVNPQTQITKGQRPLKDVLYRAAKVSRVKSHSDKRGFTEFANANGELAEFANAVQRIAAIDFGFELKLPTPPAGGIGPSTKLNENHKELLSQQLVEYIDELVRCLIECPCFGMVEWVKPGHCRFLYTTAEKSHGMIQTSYAHCHHTHELVRAKNRRLDSAAVKLPPHAQTIVSYFSGNIRREMRVITGMLVKIDEQNGATHHRDHAVGRNLKSAGRFVRKYGPSVAAGSAAGATAASVVGTIMTSLAATAATAATVVAVADPALVIGDVCLTGWIEPQE